jgi:ABC-type Fe3+/spermidine/putrescine transport system ATPase subunit
MVVQNYALFPHLTVAENVGFGLRERRVDPRQIRLNVGECLHLVHLDNLDDRYPSELSGGQQQRVALARALVIEPELLLLDEPLSNLDAQLREEMRVEIKELQAKLGITTVFVTHDQVEALTLSSRVVIMRNGRAAQTGTPEEIYRRPRARFAFEFLGGTNVFGGRLLDGGAGDPVFETASGLRLTGRGAVARPAVVRYVGLRPEELSLRPSDGLLGPNEFPGRVRSVLYRGWTREVLLTLHHGESLKVIELLPRAAHAELPADGEVTVKFPPDACHFLEED